MVGHICVSGMLHEAGPTISVLQQTQQEAYTLRCSCTNEPHSFIAGPPGQGPAESWLCCCQREPSLLAAQVCNRPAGRFAVDHACRLRREQRRIIRIALRGQVRARSAMYFPPPPDTPAEHLAHLSILSRTRA